MDAGLYRFAFPTRHLISARGKLCLEYLGELHEFEDLDTSFFYILAKMQHPFPIDQWKERYPGRKAEIEQFQSYCQSGGLLLPVTDHALVSGKQMPIICSVFTQFIMTSFFPIGFGRVWSTALPAWIW
jgi:hypothetical protein